MLALRSSSKSARLASKLANRPCSLAPAASITSGLQSRPPCEPDTVPACASPRLRNTAAFENDMRHAESTQVIARREPCLPRTDNDAVEHDLDYRASRVALDVTLAWAGVPE